MGSAADTAAIVALLRLGEGHLPAPAAEFIQRAGSGQTALEEALRLQAEPPGQLSLQPPAAREPHSLLTAAASELKRWRQADIHALTVLDPGYPRHLRATSDRPALIFVFGSLEDTDERAVAIIGSRHPSAEGLCAGRAISARLASLNYVVTSGLAAGIDTAAHVAALRTAGRTLAVVGTGVDRAYPPANAELQRRIAAQGAVISRLWPGSGPTPERFRQRNALMAGLTLATVIVEAGPTSGTRVQARAALAQERPVFLAQRVLRQGWGEQLATRPGVHVFDTPEEIAERLDAASA